MNLSSGLWRPHCLRLCPHLPHLLRSPPRKQIIDAVQKGVRPDGRMLAPALASKGLAILSREDAKALIAYLRALPPMKNKVPDPFGPTETPTSFVLKVVPPGAK